MEERITIVINLFPDEIFQYENIVEKLLKEIVSIKNYKFSFFVIMNLSDDIINWEETNITKDLFIGKFEYVKNLIQQNIGFDNYFRIEYDSDNKGINDTRRESLGFYSDYYIWIDPDISFTENTLLNIVNNIKFVKQKSNLFVICPSIPYIIEYKNYILYNVNGNPKKYHHDFNYIDINRFGKKDGKEYVDFTEQVFIWGGWFNLISRKLLEKVNGIPLEFGEYGRDDNWLFACSTELNKIKKGTVVQRVLQKSLVYDNVLFRKHNLKDLMSYKKDKNYKNNRQRDLEYIFQEKLKSFINVNKTT